MALDALPDPVLALVTNRKEEIMELEVVAPEPGSDGAPSRAGLGVVLRFFSCSLNHERAVTTAGYRPSSFCTQPGIDLRGQR